MGQLISLLLMIIAIYFVQDRYPFLAGVMAVIPIKILWTSYLAVGSDSLKESIGGMLAGHCTVTVILCVVYFYLSKGQ